MLALTIHQPWASAIVLGPKRVENRTWRPPATLVGQRLAVHAGKVLSREASEELLDDTFGAAPRGSAVLRTGALPRCSGPLGGPDRDPAPDWG